VHISQGEHGSLGGVRGGGGAGVAGRDAAPRGGRAEQRVAAIAERARCVASELLSQCDGVSDASRDICCHTWRKPRF